MVWWAEMISYADATTTRLHPLHMYVGHVGQQATQDWMCTSLQWQGLSTAQHVNRWSVDVTLPCVYVTCYNRRPHALCYARVI
jgi:hypothetical protein